MNIILIDIIRTWRKKDTTISNSGVHSSLGPSMTDFRPGEGQQKTISSFSTYFDCKKCCNTDEPTPWRSHYTSEFNIVARDIGRKNTPGHL